MELMVDFIENHPEMIFGKLSSTFTSQKRDKLWENLSVLLNSDGFGPSKKPNKWRRTWIDLKCEAKNKAAAYMKSKNLTGGGAGLQPLPALLEKVNNLIAEVLVTGNPRILETGRGGDIEINIGYEMEAGPSSLEAAGPSNYETAGTSIYLEDGPTQQSDQHGLNVRSTPRFSAKCKHRKVSARGFNDLIDVEVKKADALHGIKTQLEKISNQNEQLIKIKEEKNFLYQQRTEQLLAIANAFLEKL